jgi:hypothetical protein
MLQNGLHHASIVFFAFFGDIHHIKNRKMNEQAIIFQVLVKPCRLSEDPKGEIKTACGARL